MEKLSLDSHKLALHPDAVADWLAGKFVAPVTVELSPASTCNQRCPFCAFAYENRSEGEVWSARECREIAKKLSSSLRPSGVTVGGEGEPGLAPLPALFKTFHENGVRAGLITNGTSSAIPSLIAFAPTWIRFSINAQNGPLYGKLHGCDPRTLGDVLDRVAITVKERERRHAATTIGVQMLCFADNAKEPVSMAPVLSEIGADYLVVKPYSWHPKSSKCLLKEPDQFQIFRLIEWAQSESTDHFQIVIRENAWRAKQEKKKPYPSCFAAPFFHFIAATGDVYPCAQFVGDRNWAFGNIHLQTWEEILQSQKREQILEELAGPKATMNCRHPCRLDQANRYLYRLLKGHAHDGFI